MTRRGLSLFLALCLSLSLLPATALAAEAHDHDDGSWTPLSGDYSAATLPSGSYCLSDDVACTGGDSNGSIAVEGRVTICLNGHVLNLSGHHFYVAAGDSLTICDCNATNQTHQFSVDANGLWTLDEANGTQAVTGGVITGGSSGGSGSTYAYGGAVEIAYSGSLTLQSGTLVGNSAPSGDGGAVGMYGTGGSVTMTGGAILGNTAQDNGGGVYVGSGTFAMTGGTISHNTGGSGGGVYVGAGSLTMENSTAVSENTTAQYGGGVYVENGTLTMSDSAAITGNTGSGSGWSGGGVYLNGGSFAMSDNTAVTGNHTDGNGGGVYLNGGSFTLSGNAAITGNTAGGSGGGVYVNAGFTVSGAVDITGNQKDSGDGAADSNLHVPDGKTITIGTGGLDRTAGIGISTNRTDLQLDETLAVTGANDADYSDRFFSDNTSYSIIDEDNTVYLSGAPSHRHSICGTSGCTEHMPDVNYTALSTPGSTLSAGRYYLTGDATTSGDLEIEGDVYLCLHGHTLDLSGNSISVQPSGTLTLCDCSTDGSGKITTHSSSTVVISNSAVLNLHSGTIENTVENGTASFAVHPYGTFHMYGGEVTSDGTAVHNAGTTTVSGGAISGNGGSGTAGICSAGALTISGGVVDNRDNSDPDAYAVVVLDGPTSDLTLSGRPVIAGGSAAADLGLSTAADTAVADARVDATGYTGSTLSVVETAPTVGACAIKGGEGKFTLLNSGYGYLYQNDGHVIHTHSYTYAADENVITESCVCGHSATATLSIPDTADLAYTGSEITPAVVTYGTAWAGGDLTITYADNRNAGTATASITMGGATASTEFEILAPLYLGGVGLWDGSYVTVSDNVIGAPVSGAPGGDVDNYAYYDGTALTLKNFVFTGGGRTFTYNNECTALLLATTDLTIKLEGENHLTLNDAAGKYYIYGVFVGGQRLYKNLTFHGTGSLTVGFAEELGLSGVPRTSYGIYSRGSFNISSGKVTATAGTTQGGSSVGIGSNNNMNITGGTVNATGGWSNSNSYGIESSRLTVSGGAQVTAQGGLANTSSYGVYCSSLDLKDDDTRLTATGGSGTTSGVNNGYGVWLQSGSSTISGGTLTASAQKVSRGYGIYLGYDSSSALTVSGGTVTASGGTEINYGYGIYTERGGMKVTGGEVTATGGTGGGDNYGAYFKGSYSLDVQGGTVILSGTSGAAYKAPAIAAGLPVVWSEDATGSDPQTGTDYTWSGQHKYIQVASDYTVSFDLNGGSGSVPSQTVPIGEAAEEPADAPTKPGCVFAGWYSENALWSFSTVVPGSMTLTAKWITTPQITAGNSVAQPYGTADGQVSVTVTEETGHTYAYQWYVKGPGATDFTAVEDADSAACAIDGFQTVGAYYYKCKVTAQIDGSTVTASEESSVITVTIQAKEYADGGSITVEDIPEQTYTGQPITPSVTVKDGERSLTENTDYRLEYADHTAAGTATVTIYFQGNYSGQMEKTFVIAYAALPSGTDLTDIFPNYTADWTQSDTLETDGGWTVSTTPDGTYGSSLNLTEGDHADNVVYVRNSSGDIHEIRLPYKLDQTDPAVGAISTTEPADGSWTNRDVTVSFTPTDGASGVQSVMVSKGGVPVTCTPGGNGQYSFVAPENGDYTITVTDAAGNTKTETVAISKIDKTEPTLVVTGGMLGKAELTLTVGVENNIPSGIDKITVKRDSAGEETVSGGVYTITQAGSYVFTATTGSGMTDEQRIEVYSIAFDGKGGSETAQQLVISGGKITEPEADPAKSGYDFGGWYSPDKGRPWYFETDTVTKNVGLEASWAIQQPTVTLTADETEATYDGGRTVITLTAGYQHGASVRVTGYEWWYKDSQGENSRQLTEVTGSTLELTDVADSGTYTVTVRVSDGQLSTFGTANSSVTINPDEVEIPQADDTAFTYNGAAQTYSIPDSSLYTVEGNVKTDADSYEVTVALTDPDNYVWTGGGTADQTYPFTIAPKPITGTWKGLRAEYNGQPQNVSIVLDGLAAGDEDLTAVIAAQDGDMTSAGKHVLTATLGNYVITPATETLVIQKKTVHFTVENNAVEAGSGNQATITVNGCTEDDYEIFYKDKEGAVVASPTEPGQYEIWVRFTDSNFTHTDGSSEMQVGSLTITDGAPKLYTAAFQGGEGAVGAMDARQMAGGSLLRLPENGFVRTGHSFTGWLYNGRLYRPGDAVTMPNGDAAFLAQWQQTSGTVSGSVVDESGGPVQGAVVSLWQGAGKLAETVTDAAGAYQFSDLLPGVYNLVVSKGRHIVTSMVTIADGAAAHSVTLPSGITNTVVDVAPGSPDVTVGQMDTMFGETDGTVYTEEDQNRVEAGGKVEFTFTAQEQQESQVEEETLNMLRSAGGSNLSLFMDYTLEKAVYDQSGQKDETASGPLAQANVLLEIRLPLPTELQGKHSYSVQRTYGGEAQRLTTQPNELGEYFEVNAEKTVLTLHVKCVSLYAVGYGNASSSGYTPTVNSGENGSVSVTPRRPARGDKVTITPKPDAGYALEKITVTDRNGNAVKLTDNGDGTWSFTQPSGKVTISVTFRPISSWADCPRDESCPLAGFTDVQLDAWYHDGVHYSIEQGLMVGTGETVFSPDDAMTRGMLVTILWRMEGSPVVEDPLTFDDVDLGTWYAEAVRWAASEGIVTGYSDVLFAPNQPIIREQMAAIFWRYARYKDMDVSVGENTNILSYADFAQISEYAIPAMQWTCGAGIINGTSDSTLSPQGAATRAQAATMLMRLCAQGAN